MNPEVTKKIIRCCLIGLIFFPVLGISGVEYKQAQQMMVMLATIIIFSLLLRNIWITLFLTWTVGLYFFFKFESGGNYISNIFIGSVIYYLVKVDFKKEHLRLFINGVLWFTLLNCLYMVLQYFNFDFYFMEKTVFTGDLNKIAGNVRMYGLMGSYWSLACLLALSIPLLASKGTWLSRIGAISLFFPLYLCNTSLCLVMGVVGLLFVLWFQIKRIVWVFILIIMLSFSVFYVTKIDKPGIGIRAKMWKTALEDASKHPFSGNGLDSFRNVTKNKPYRYVERIADRGSVIWKELWDNPHNLYISLFFEFSLVGLIIFFCYLRGLAIKYIRAIKSPCVIGLAAFVLVFLGVSFAHFPLHLARFMPILIPAFAMLEVASG